MNIVFAVQNNDGLNSVISSRYGRTLGFICYNTSDNEWSYHSNEENVHAGHGAGIQAAQNTINLKANLVITGGTIGPKAFQVLNEAQISVITQVGEISVEQAISSYSNGAYSVVVESDQ